MKYSIKEVSEMAGVSARTLRYYDQIGLLKPMETSEAGYRYYGEHELAVLQQILFYRERNFDLKKIRQIVYQKDFDIMHALEEHLLDLEEQSRHMESLIQTVKQTIRSMKGECSMSDKERFEVFKENVIAEHEKKYGTEIREKYGDEEVEDSYDKIRGMSEEDYERFQNLGTEICQRLAESVTAGVKPESEDGRRIVLLHKEWLGRSWKRYSEEAHKAIASMYIADERFKAYYDKEVEGCAEFLECAIRYWVDRI